MRRGGRALTTALVAVALLAARNAGAACADVDFDLDVTPRLAQDGAELTYTATLCDPTGFGADVAQITFGLNFAKFIPWSGAWVSCPTANCTVVSPDGQLKVGPFALAASQCQTFVYRMTLQLGQPGSFVCQSGQATVRSRSPPISPTYCDRASDDPQSPPGLPTCVETPPPPGGCSVTVNVAPGNLDTCPGGLAELTSQASATSCPGGALSYQWSKEGVDIPGANGPSWAASPNEALGHTHQRLRAWCTAEPLCTALSGLAHVYVYALSATLVAPAAACPGDAVPVTVTDGVNCTLDCGNGTAPAASCSTVCTYPTSGRYTIDATYSDGSCAARERRVIDVAALDLDAEAAPPSACAGEEVTFTATGPGPTVTYAWDFDDGGSATTAVARHTFATGGTYAVRVVATNPASGCTAAVDLPYSVSAVCCAAPPPAVSLVTAIKTGAARGAVELAWPPAGGSTDAYAVWEALDRSAIDDARAPGGAPGIRTVCAPAALLACIDPGAVTGGPGPRGYYQVRALCAGNEGP